jgi:hypothetical protein
MQAYAADGSGEKGSSWGQETKIASACRKKKREEKKKKTTGDEGVRNTGAKMFEMP